MYVYTLRAYTCAIHKYVLHVRTPVRLTHRYVCMCASYARVSHYGFGYWPIEVCCRGGDAVDARV